MLAFMAAGLALRLLYFSGFGLGDDFIFRNEVNTVLVAKTVIPDNQAYRFIWWFPTALSCRIFGLNEVGLVLPFTAAATLGTGLVYALGKTLHGRAGAAIAALLLLFHPLDFAWSTMLTNDLMLSVVSAATMLLVTGGSREPYYGCPHCIPRASELQPGRWQLVRELPGPAVFGTWRPEPVRIWQPVPP